MKLNGVGQCKDSGGDAVMVLLGMSSLCGVLEWL